MFVIKNLVLPNNLKINFNWDSQDLIIRGRNGLGKSLFLKALANLVPVKYDSFIFNKVSLRDWKPEIYRSQVLYVGQAMPKEAMTVEEYLHQPFGLKVYQGQVPLFETQSYLEQWDLARKDVALLSMGQRQLLSLLRATSLGPKVLLLDEPASNLDQQKTIEAEKIIRDWKDKANGKIIMISHDDQTTNRLQYKEVNLSELT